MKTTKKAFIALNDISTHFNMLCELIEKHYTDTNLQNTNIYKKTKTKMLKMYEQLLNDTLL